MPIRKHKGINQKTGKLKKGFKYSGKKLKSGLPVIVKIQKGGFPVKPKVFKQKGPSEKKYNDCRQHGCTTDTMSYCCNDSTPSDGYCRTDLKGCFKTGINTKPRKRNLSPVQLAKLRKNMDNVYLKEKISKQQKELEKLEQSKPVVQFKAEQKKKRTGFLPPVPVFKMESKKSTQKLSFVPKKTRSSILLPPHKIQDPIKKAYTKEFNKQRRKKLSEMDKMAYIERLNKKLLKGGAILGQGGFGCVISPSLICKKGEKSSKDKISKLMNDKDAFIEETENIEIMKSLDPDMKYFLYPISFCEFDEKLNNKSFLGCFSCGSKRDIETCKSKMGIDGEEEYVLYNVVQPFGGKDLYKAVEDTITRQLFTKNFEYYKEYLTKGINSMHKKGIIHRDVKPENIVLNNKGEIRFIDIGFVHKLNPSDFKTEKGLRDLLGARTIFFRPLDMDMMEFWIDNKKYRTLYWSGFFKAWQKKRPVEYNEDIGSIAKFNGWNKNDVIDGLEKLFNKLSVKFIAKYMKDNIYKWDTYSLHLSFNEMAQMLTPKATDKQFGFDSGIAI